IARRRRSIGSTLTGGTTERGGSARIARPTPGTSLSKSWRSTARGGILKSIRPSRVLDSPQRLDRVMGDVLTLGVLCVLPALIGAVYLLVRFVEWLSRHFGGDVGPPRAPAEPRST